MSPPLVDSSAEPAWQVVKPAEEGIIVWRVNQLKLEVVPQKEHGEFYDGDTYIILHSFKQGNRMVYDAYMWIGEESSQDEYSFGAYKLVELDSSLLKDAATQYREVQGAESSKFMQVFPSLSILQGGNKTGFNKVEVDKTPKLFHISGEKKSVRIMQVPFFSEIIQSDDVYIIDLCDTVYLFRGKDSNKEEKFFATQCITSYKSKKPTAKYETIDESSDGRPADVFSRIPSGGKSSSAIEAMKCKPPGKEEFILVKVSDASGEVKFTAVAQGHPKLSQLDTSDIFVLSVKTKIFVWVGKASTETEKRSAIVFAQKFADAQKLKLSPIEVVKEGNESIEFTSSFS